MPRLMGMLGNSVIGPMGPPGLISAKTELVTGMPDGNVPLPMPGGLPLLMNVLNWAMVKLELVAQRRAQ